MSKFSIEFLDIMKEHGDLAKNLSVSEEELESMLLAFSTPTSKDIGEMTQELLNKLSGGKD